MSDALSWLRETRGGVIAAGCTDLFPATERKTLPGPVLDVTGIDALRGIRRTDTGCVFGATTTWMDVIRADLPPAFDGLKAAAREVGSVQIQNSGTIAGNLCNASPAADGTPCWLTLEAQVQLAGPDGERSLPVAEFVTGPRQTALAPGEIVTALTVPAKAALGVSSFVKLGARKYLVISIAMVAARVVVEEERIAEAALSIGSCSPVPVRLPEVEQALIGNDIFSAANCVSAEQVGTALAPIDDVRADAAYRSESAMELIRRAILSCNGVPV